MIRPATLADALAIARLHAENWRTTYRGAYSDSFLDGNVYANRERVWRERLVIPNERQAAFLAERNGALLGFVCAFGDHDPTWGTLIDNLHVAASERGTGLGRRLMDRAFEWSRTNYPSSGVYLWVLFNNTNAMRFYEHLGGRDVGGATKEAPDGQPVDARRYVWEAGAIPRLRPEGSMLNG
ncbi:MAG TPA: GNAT family N-acetyltransferase [Gemmatimonadaceae bacterium]|nr:GNAT family N-acetyltransferase [Gemmatimonadaceae bacterium]